MFQKQVAFRIIDRQVQNILCKPLISDLTFSVSKLGPYLIVLVMNFVL